MSDPQGWYIADANGFWMSGTHQGPAWAGDGFTLGITKPSSLNTGVPAGWTPTITYTVDMTLTAGNQTYTNALFNCKVTIKSNSNRFINCKFQGPVTWTTQRPLIYMIDILCDGGIQNYYERCTMRPQTPLHGVDTLQGYNFYLNRCDLSHGVDGLDILAPVANGYDANVRIDGCYVHDEAYFCPDTNQSNNHTHNDGIQFANGIGFTSTGSFYSCFWDTAVGDGNTPGTFGTLPNGSAGCLSGNFNDNVSVGGQPPELGLNFGNAQIQFNTTGTSTVDNIHFISCWFEGGFTGFNIIDGQTISVLEIRNCIFDPPMAGKNNIIRDATTGTVPVTFVGNKYTDGTAILGTVGNGRTNLG